MLRRRYFSFERLPILLYTICSIMQLFREKSQTVLLRPRRKLRNWNRRREGEVAEAKRRLFIVELLKMGAGLVVHPWPHAPAHAVLSPNLHPEPERNQLQHQACNRKLFTPLHSLFPGSSATVTCGQPIELPSLDCNNLPSFLDTSRSISSRRAL